MDRTARNQTNKFCSFCKRTNHTIIDCYHRKRRVKEKQNKCKDFNTEPHKTLSKRQFGEFHNEITSKGDCKESNLNNNCEKVTTKSSNENDKSDTKSKIELRLKIKRLKNKLDKLTIENRFLREENLSLSLLYFSSNTTPFIDNWTKGSRCGSSKEV